MLECTCCRMLAYILYLAGLICLFTLAHYAVEIMYPRYDIDVDAFDGRLIAPQTLIDYGIMDPTTFHLIEMTTNSNGTTPFRSDKLGLNHEWSSSNFYGLIVILVVTIIIGAAVLSFISCNVRATTAVTKSGKAGASEGGGSCSCCIVEGKLETVSQSAAMAQYEPLLASHGLSAGLLREMESVVVFQTLRELDVPIADRLVLMKVVCLQRAPKPLLVFRLFLRHLLGCDHAWSARPPAHVRARVCVCVCVLSCVCVCGRRGCRSDVVVLVLVLVAVVVVHVCVCLYACVCVCDCECVPAWWWWRWKLNQTRFHWHAPLMLHHGHHAQAISAEMTVNVGLGM